MILWFEQSAIKRGKTVEIGEKATKNNKKHHLKNLKASIIQKSFTVFEDWDFF